MDNILYVENVKYKYIIGKDNFILSNNKEQFKFEYKNINYISKLNINKFELFFIIIGILASTQIWWGLTLVLAFYAFIRWYFGKMIMIMQDGGNVSMSFSSIDGKNAFLKKLCKEENYFCSMFKMNK